MWGKDWKSSAVAVIGKNVWYRMFELTMSLSNVKRQASRKLSTKKTGILFYANANNNRGVAVMYGLGPWDCFSYLFEPTTIYSCSSCRGSEALGGGQAKGDCSINTRFIPGSNILGGISVVFKPTTRLIDAEGSPGDNTHGGIPAVFNPIKQHLVYRCGVLPR